MSLTHLTAVKQNKTADDIYVSLCKNVLLFIIHVRILQPDVDLCEISSRMFIIILSSYIRFLQFLIFILLWTNMRNFCEQIS